MDFQDFTKVSAFEALDITQVKKDVASFTRLAVGVITAKLILSQRSFWKGWREKRRTPRDVKENK